MRHPSFTASYGEVEACTPVERADLSFSIALAYRAMIYQWEWKTQVDWAVLIDKDEPLETRPIYRQQAGQAFQQYARQITEVWDWVL